MIILYIILIPKVEKENSQSIQAQDTCPIENKWRPPKWEQTEAIYSEFAVARDSATIAWIGQSPKGGQGSGKVL